MGGETPVPPTERYYIQDKKSSKKNINYNTYESIYQTIFWIDQDINNKENLNHQKYFKGNIGTYNLKVFNNIQDFSDIIKTIKFKVIFVLISGSLYADYYMYLKNIKNELTNNLINIIFTSSNFKKILLNEEPNKYNIKQEILNSINDSYYNLGGVASKKEEVVNYIKSFLGLKYEIGLNYQDALTFEVIDMNNYEQLIFPSFYGKIEMKENIIDDEDIEDFNNILIQKHDYTVKGISELITLYKKIGKIPLEILTKYWIRYYTSESSFYSVMNAQFMKNDYKNYEPFVKALYKGLEKKFLKSKNDVPLYRCQCISKIELENIEKALVNKKRIQIYSRAFLSFSINKNISLRFLKKIEDEKLIPVLLIIDKKEDGEIFASNADIRQYSVYNEEEILFFPFSSFIIEEKIEEQIIKGIKTKIIKLNYLGKYEKEIKLKISETLDNNIDLNDIIGVDKNWKYSNDVLNKTMKEKYIKNLDFYISHIEEEMKNELKGKKTKKSTIEDESKIFTPYQ